MAKPPEIISWETAQALQDQRDYWEEQAEEFEALAASLMRALWAAYRWGAEGEHERCQQLLWRAYHDADQKMATIRV